MDGVLRDDACGWVCGKGARMRRDVDGHEHTEGVVPVTEVVGGGETGWSRRSQLVDILSAISRDSHFRDVRTA